MCGRLSYILLYSCAVCIPFKYKWLIYWEIKYSLSWSFIDMTNQMNWIEWMCYINKLLASFDTSQLSRSVYQNPGQKYLTLFCLRFTYVLFIRMALSDSDVFVPELLDSNVSISNFHSLEYWFFLYRNLRSYRLFVCNCILTNCIEKMWKAIVSFYLKKLETLQSTVNVKFWQLVFRHLAFNMFIKVRVTSSLA